MQGGWRVCKAGGAGCGAMSTSTCKQRQGVQLCCPCSDQAVPWLSFSSWQVATSRLESHRWLARYTAARASAGAAPYIHICVSHAYSGLPSHSNFHIRNGLTSAGQLESCLASQSRDWLHFVVDHRKAEQAAAYILRHMKPGHHADIHPPGCSVGLCCEERHDGLPGPAHPDDGCGWRHPGLGC